MLIIEDITNHTMKAMHQAEQLGGWKALPQKDLFEMEYWSLEQAKLKKAGKAKDMTRLVIACPSPPVTSRCAGIRSVTRHGSVW
jgi:hypothetical protein